MDDDKKQQAAVLKAKTAAFWTLLLGSNISELRGPLQMKLPYEKLSRDQRITIAVFLTEFESLCNGINAKAQEQTANGKASEETSAETASAET